MVALANLLNGIVVETQIKSYTGNILYSDYAVGFKNKNTILNTCTKIPCVGIAAGIVRMALGILHTLGHLFAALITRNKGHLYHAAKGACEITRGSIEALPIIGRIFAHMYMPHPLQYIYRDGWEEGRRSWWMIKIYNPQKPDGLDEWMHNWSHFPRELRIKA